jgi:two-component system repressor protein LuxO
MKINKQMSVLCYSTCTNITCKNQLKQNSVKLTHVETGAAALEHLKKNVPTIILLDVTFSDMNHIIKYVQQQQFNSAIVVRLAEKNTLCSDIYDLFLKKIEVNSPSKIYINGPINQIKNNEDNKDDEDNEFMIGTSQPMQDIFQKIDMVAASNASVFITGESGTGKEICAQAIHEKSSRKKKTFFVINCAAIPHDLMESELFGHVKGSFTGADKDREGIASVADGGTLFLDEIGDMPLDLQSKLLRFVESGTFHKVGSNKLKKVDIRFICATNRDPLAQIKGGDFRYDLYYRLNVISIHLPPLHERGTDVLMIAQSFLKKYNIIEHKFFQKFTSDAENILLTYHWPGNIRQLQNIIHRMVLLNNGEIITADMLSNVLDDKQDIPPIIKTPTIIDTPNKKIIPLSQLERQAIEEAIKFCDGNIEQTAKLLEIGKSTLYRKLNLWNITFERIVKPS